MRKMRRVNTKLEELVEVTYGNPWYEETFGVRIDMRGVG